MSLRLEILRGPKDPMLLSKSAASDRATILSFCRHEIAHAGDAGKKQGVLRRVKTTRPSAGWRGLRMTVFWGDSN